MTRHQHAARHRWRAGSLVVCALAGFLFATTSFNAKGMDLRAASVTDLDHVVRQERARADHLQARVAALNEEIGTLTARVRDAEVAKLRRQVATLRDPAGFSAVSGPGVTVELSDAPKSQIDRVGDPGGVQPDQLVVHQQDIQAVVNALWSGGAEAMTIQRQRVISTTGIKCVGNTVVLHGVPYAPPYRISAIGDPEALLASLEDSDYLDAYRTFVDAYQLGWKVSSSSTLKMPAFTGGSALSYARPLIQFPEPRD